MAFEITWHRPRPSGNRTCEFEHLGQIVVMSASMSRQVLWAGEPESIQWLKDRDVWAQEAAQRIAGRMDYAASEEGVRAAKQAEYDEHKRDIEAATEKRVEMKEEFPYLTGEVSDGS